MKSAKPVINGGNLLTIIGRREVKLVLWRVMSSWLPGLFSGNSPSPSSHGRAMGRVIRENVSQGP